MPVAAPPPEPPKPLPGGADKRRIIGILDVRIDGAPPEVGAQFQKDLEAQVENIKAAYFLAPKMRMHDLMAQSTKWSEGCVVGACLKYVKDQTNADIVLLAALTGSGTSVGWVVPLVRSDTGNVLAQKSERCDVLEGGGSEALSAADPRDGRSALDDSGDPARRELTSHRRSPRRTDQGAGRQREDRPDRASRPRRRQRR